MEDQTGVPVTPRLGGRHRLGDYEILSVAGSGGMGLVYRARQRSLGRVVALKVIRDEVASAPAYRERFMREPRLAASVDHPNIISVYEVGEEDGQLFLAMQWIDGEDLGTLIEKRRRLPPERAIRIATQLAGALHAVHTMAGLVHRDVKPPNVLIRQVRGGDHAYLTDFGIAKVTDGSAQLTQPGGVVGTPGYMSPEQIVGLEPGPQSDLYALGCVFYESITGEAPFRGTSDIALMWAHANDPRPVPSTVVPELGDRYDHFVSVALAIDPAQRFESGEAFADALDALHPTKAAPQLTSPPLPIIVGPDTPIPPTVPSPQRSRQAAAGQSAHDAETPQASPPQAPPGYTPPPPTPGYTPEAPPPYTPQQPPLAYPPYGYVTPPPAATPSNGGGNRLALIVLGLVALAGLALGAVAAGGLFSPKTSTQTTTVVGKGGASSTGGTGSSSTSTSSSTSIPSGPATVTTACGGGVSIGPNTSCGFAETVAHAYDRTAGGTQAVNAYSPAAERTYTIDCRGGSPVACTGGTTVGASIYFTYAPVSPSGGANLTACDPNISVNSVTSCPFAENVFKAYADQYNGNGGQANAVVSAFSPVTKKIYSMSCANSGAAVSCTGGINSYVTFPLHAAQVY